MICKSDRCTKEAIAEVFWPGKTTEACAEHAAKMQRIASAMGFAVAARPLPVEDDHV